MIIRLSNIELQTITDAQREVNSLIRVGRKVKTHSFETMDDARTHFPNLRVNEDRIKQSKVPIRVIEIEGHDVAACAMDHAGDLHECEFFLITRISRAGRTGEYEINFAVQTRLRKHLSCLSQKLLQDMSESGG